MLFPVIRVIDRDVKGMEPHIVGTNSHDELRVDEETGGLQYHNLQNGEGSKRYGEDDYHAYDFVAPREVDAEGYGPGDMRVEFVTMEQLMELYIEQIKASAETAARWRKILDDLFAEEDEIKKAAGLDSEDDGPIGVIF